MSPATRFSRDTITLEQRQADRWTSLSDIVLAQMIMLSWDWIMMHRTQNGCYNFHLTLGPMRDVSTRKFPEICSYQIAFKTLDYLLSEEGIKKQWVCTSSKIKTRWCRTKEDNEEGTVVEYNKEQSEFTDLVKLVEHAAKEFWTQRLKITCH